MAAIPLRCGRCKVVTGCPVLGSHMTSKESDPVSVDTSKDRSCEAIRHDMALRCPCEQHESASGMSAQVLQ